MAKFQQRRSERKRKIEEEIKWEEESVDKWNK